MKKYSSTVLLAALGGVWGAPRQNAESEDEEIRGAIEGRWREGHSRKRRMLSVTMALTAPEAPRQYRSLGCPHLYSLWFA